MVGLSRSELACVPFFLGVILIDKTADVPRLTHIWLWRIFSLGHGLLGGLLVQILRLMLRDLRQAVFIWRWTQECYDFFFFFCWRIFLFYFLWLRKLLTRTTVFHF
jgi:hypothetical protein